MLRSRQDRIRVAKGAAILASVPLLILGFAGGPDPRRTGAPGDDRLACASAGCHTGTAVNGGPGRVEIAFPSGLTYVPGQRQRWTVTVTDAQQRVFGFQATARLESDLSNGQAGAFSAVDSSVQVLCDDGRLKAAAGCGQFPVEFVQHARPANAPGTFTFEWMPPASAVGNIRVYVAGNAANGNGTNSGDRIYTANYMLTPQSGGGGPRPTITAVTDGFNFRAGISPNTWTTLFGTNLSTETKDWASDLQGTRLPTTVGGVSVTVNSRPAVVQFVSPGQINILTPNDIGTGEMNVVVRNANGESTPATARAAAFQPAFYAPFAQNNRFYVTAVSLRGEFVGRRGTDPRVTRAARPGEILQIFGTGFGPTNPVVPVDQVVSGAPAVTTPVRIRFGESVATVAGTGNLVAAGLYQFNVTVPDTLADGEYVLLAEVGGVTSSSSVLIPVER